MAEKLTDVKRTSNIGIKRNSGTSGNTGISGHSSSSTLVDYPNWMVDYDKLHKNLPVLENFEILHKNLPVLENFEILPIKKEKAKTIYKDYFHE